LASLGGLRVVEMACEHLWLNLMLAVLMVEAEKCRGDLATHTRTMQRCSAMTWSCHLRRQELN
jgi:hypothetical protein